MSDDSIGLNIDMLDVDKLRVWAVATDDTRRAAHMNDLAVRLDAAIRDIGKLRARVRELEQAQAWQPIETIPRDHSYVLLRSDSGYVTTPYRIEVGYCDDAYRPLEPIRCLDNKSWLDAGPSLPTHWKPL